MGRLPLVALCLAGAIAFGATTWRLIDSPVRWDECEHAVMAMGVALHGVPKILYSESRQIPTPANEAVDGRVEKLGMWHPPAFLYSMAASYKIFGRTNWSARLPGLLWFVLAAVVMWRVSGVLAVALACLSPLILHGVFYLDIDGTSLGFAIVLFAAVFARNPGDHSIRQTLILSALILFALWSKLSTPVIALMAVGVYHLLNRDARGIAQALAIAALSAAAFAATYWLYCRLTGYPADFMWNFSYVGKRDLYVVPTSMMKRLHAVWWTVIWFSPALSLLLAAMTIDRARSFFERRQLEPMDFWLIFSWACFGAYAVWSGVIGKYTVPAGLAAAVALALWLPGRFREVRVTRPFLLISAVAALAVLQVTAIPALEVKSPAIDGLVSSVADALTNPRNITLGLTLAGFGAFLAIAWRSVASTSRQAKLAALLVACVVVSNTVNCLKVMSSPDDRSPFRPFRERGFEAMIDTINRELSPDGILIAPKDVGFYFKGRSYHLESIRDRDGASFIVPLIRDKGVRYAVDSRLNPAVPAAMFSDGGLVEMRRVGDFTIYQRASGGH